MGGKKSAGCGPRTVKGRSSGTRVVTELRQRVVEDILIACVDGLTGFPEAIKSVFPQTQVQVCIVHLAQNSLRVVTDKDRTAVVAALKEIYRAPTVEAAQAALTKFEEEWERRSAGGQEPADELEPDHRVLQFPGRDSAGHLHDQGDRVAQLHAAQGDQKPESVSD